MDEFEQSDLEKETNDSHNTCYQNAIRYVIDKLRVAEAYPTDLLCCTKTLLPL